MPLTRHQRLGLVLALVAAAYTIWLHRFFLHAPGSVAFDDGYTLAVAERMLAGHWLPYVDGVSHRGPLLYWLVAIADFLGGGYSWTAARWLMLVMSLLTIAGISSAASFAGRPVAGGFAALLYVFTALVGLEPAAAFGISGETIAAALAALGLAGASWAFAVDTGETRRPGLLFASGVLVALAGLTKQTALPLCLPLALWILAVERRLLIPFALGFATPLVLTFGRYLIAGQLGTFWYWFYGYNAQVYMSPYEHVPLAYSFQAYLRNQSWQFLFLALPIGAGIARYVGAVRSFERGRGLLAAYATRGFDFTQALFVLSAFVAIAMPQRFWTSYFSLVLPFASLALALEIDAAIERTKPREVVSSLVLGALLALWVGYTTRIRVADLQAGRNAGQWPAAHPDPLCDALAHHSADREPVFIWGFDGDWYVSCRRFPASRFTYLTPVAGIVPPFWSEVVPSRIAKGAREALLADLRDTKPVYVVDSPDSLRGASMSLMPELVSWVHENYCDQGSVESKNGRHANLWLRKDRCP